MRTEKPQLSNGIIGFGLIGIFLGFQISFFILGGFLNSIIFEPDSMAAGGLFPGVLFSLITNPFNFVTALIFLFALIGGGPGILVGFFVGRLYGNKISGMEYGLAGGMIFSYFIFGNGFQSERILALILASSIGMFGFFIGKTTGRTLGKLISEKFN